MDQEIGTERDQRTKLNWKQINQTLPTLSFEKGYTRILKYLFQQNFHSDHDS